MDQLFLQIRFSYHLNVLKADHVLCLPEYVIKLSRKHFLKKMSLLIEVLK